MEKEALRWRLPENPPKGMVSWVKENCGEELGRDITVFRHERIRPAPPLEDIMEYNTLKGKSVWATYCSCHACGESYYTEKVEGADAFYVIDGEDGVVYTADPGGNYDGTDGTMVPVEENDGFLCPICGAETRAVKARSIRGGRTKQIQVASLHAIDGYAVIVYWLVRRNINEFGSFCDAVPRYAFALGEKGGIQAFSHVRENGFYNETRRTESPGFSLPSRPMPSVRKITASNGARMKRRSTNEKANHHPEAGDPVPRVAAGHPGK